MFLAVNHLSPVIGVDVHAVVVPPAPPAAPVMLPHPHVGMVLDLDECLNAACAACPALGAAFNAYAQIRQVTNLVMHPNPVAIASMVGGMAMQQVIADNPEAVKAVMDSSVVKAATGIANTVSDIYGELGGNVGKGGGRSNPVLVNGFLRATAGTHTFHFPGLHFPIGAAWGVPDIKEGKPSQDSESFMGSKTVLANGDPFSFMALPSLSCWFTGMPPMKHNGAHTERHYTSMPTSVLLPLMAGRPVFVGGPPIMNLLAMVWGLFKASGLACKFSHAIQDKFAGTKWSDQINQICRSIFGEPVDARTGEVIVQQHDFTVKGRFPLVWNRYYAGHDARMGALGYGWESPADTRLTLFAHEDAIGAVACFPDKWVAFEQIPQAVGWEHRVGEGVGGHTLCLGNDCLVVRTRDSVEYRFALRDGWRQAALRAEFERPLTLPLAQLNDLNGNGWLIDRAEETRTAYGHRQSPPLRYVEWSGEHRTGREVIFSAGNVQGCLGSVTL